MSYISEEQLEEGDLPKCVLINFVNDTIESRMKDEDGCVAITPIAKAYQANKLYRAVEP